MKIGVLMGGVSSERAISIMTGNEVIENLDKNKYEVTGIILDNEYELLEKVKPFDFIFIALHGKFGEDGKVQAILDSMGKPYTGCGVLASALCMDKGLSKKIFQADGIKTPKWISFKHYNEVTNDLLEGMEFPLIIKPNAGGSSIGISIVKCESELKKAIEEALKCDREVIIEEFIDGEEITCPILEGKLLPVIRIKSKSEFFNYSSKYFDIATEETIVSYKENIMSELAEVVNKCWRSFGLKIYARIDMIIRDNEIYVLEINTLPGMTKSSLFLKSAAAIGMSFSSLLDQIIEASLK